MFCVVFFFKQKTAYEMRISDWSSDVCSSDLDGIATVGVDAGPGAGVSGKGDAAAVDGAGTSGCAGTFSTGSSPFPMSAVPTNPTIASMSSMTSGTGGAAVGKAVSLRGHSQGGGDRQRKRLNSSLPCATRMAP